MRAASRAAIGLAVALGLVGAPAPPAAAQSVAASGPRCPAFVADQPLSAAAPFSGTVRPRADDQGRIGSFSLLCAYGAGASPSAEVTVTWGAGSVPCATSDLAVAPTLDGAPFDRLAIDLATGAGTACGPSSAGGWPRPALAGGLVVAAGLALLGLRRRRGRRATGPAVVDADASPPEDSPASPLVGPTSPAAAPDPGPVRAALDGRGGRAFAHTGSGQLAVLAAVAYGSGDSITGDLARAGSIAVLPVGLRPRAEVAALAWDHAHKVGSVDR